ncbi:hypothetical protein D3C83_234740 [compost metagenome]
MQRSQPVLRDQAAALAADIQLVEDGGEADRFQLADDGVTLAVVFEHVVAFAQVHGPG